MSEERMQDSNLPPEISRLYADLADRIIARDEEGASRIYYELLRAGRPLEILADATRVPALRKTLELALFGERAVKEQGSKIPDEPPQQDSALPKVSTEPNRSRRPTLGLNDRLQNTS